MQDVCRPIEGAHVQDRQCFFECLNGPSRSQWVVVVEGVLPADPRFDTIASEMRGEFFHEASVTSPTDAADEEGDSSDARENRSGYFMVRGIMKTVTPTRRGHQRGLKQINDG